jgi:hypothetical protein
MVDFSEHAKQARLYNAKPEPEPNWRSMYEEQKLRNENIKSELTDLCKRREFVDMYDIFDVLNRN